MENLESQLTEKWLRLRNEEKHKKQYTHDTRRKQLLHKAPWTLQAHKNKHCSTEHTNRRQHTKKKKEKKNGVLSVCVCGQTKKKQGTKAEQGGNEEEAVVVYGGMKKKKNERHSWLRVRISRRLCVFFVLRPKQHKMREKIRPARTFGSCIIFHSLGKPKEHATSQHLFLGHFICFA